jgi:serine protease Do
LIAEGKFTRSWIGIKLKELKDYPAYKNLDKKLAPDTDSGIVVTDIIDGGPASKSGLRTGDVIVSVQGKTVETARQLKDSVAPEKPGRVLTLNVVRAREHLVIKMQTEAMPSNDELAEATPQPERGAAETPIFGLTIEALTQDLADRDGVDLDSGVIVTAVAGNSPAAAEGIQPGDVITQINRQPVPNLQQFHQALGAADAKKGIMVDLISNGSSRLVILKNGGQ